MKGLVIGLVALALLAFAIGAFVPASMIDARVAARTGGALRIADTQGTVWRGRGVLTASDGSWRMPLAWRLAPSPLVRGVVDVTLYPLDAVTDAPRGHVQLAQGRVRADQLVLRLPARALLTPLGSDAMLAGGDITLRADEIALARTGSNGGALAEWRNARLLIPGRPVLDLGTVTARVGVSGNDLAGPIASRGGQVSVSGEIVLGDARVSLSLELAPEASAGSGVRAALAALGPTDARGAVRLRVDRGAR